MDTMIPLPVDIRQHPNGKVHLVDANGQWICRMTGRKGNWDTRVAGTVLKTALNQQGHLRTEIARLKRELAAERERCYHYKNALLAELSYH